jgi:hypothetical protein
MGRLFELPSKRVVLGGIAPAELAAAPLINPKKDNKIDIRGISPLRLNRNRFVSQYIRINVETNLSISIYLQHSVDIICLSKASWSISLRQPARNCLQE